MIIACIGDSLTEGDYGIRGQRGIANVHKDNYPNYLAGLTGAEVRNFGKCGYRSSTVLQYYKDGGIDVHGADLVLVMLGTNGGQSPTEDTQDNRAYDELISCLRADANGPVILMTPLHATVDPAYSNCGYAPQVADAVAFVRKYAKERVLPLLDIAACTDFCAENEALYQANDGLHCVAAGYQKLAQIIANALNLS